jgi:predicted dehydrogenase
MGQADAIGVGLVGYGETGRAHSHAWGSVNRFFDLPLRPRMTAICGRDGAAVAAAADRLGWESHERDWTALVGRDDVDLVDVCAPGDAHAEIAIAALRAGKHVLCEKPLAATVEEARRMAAAAEEARAYGVRAMCGFDHRRLPAVALMRRLVADGRLGPIRQVRAQYLRDRPGSAWVGVLGAHVVDLAQYVTGRRIWGVSALTETFGTEFPPAPGMDDAALFLARFDGGAVGTFEATRLAPGRRDALRIEVDGAAGSVGFDLERRAELRYHDATAPAAESGFRRILATSPDHPDGHGVTYEIRDLLEDVAAGRDPAPDFTDGLHVQLVLDAVERSAAD